MVNNDFSVLWGADWRDSESCFRGRGQIRILTSLDEGVFDNRAFRGPAHPGWAVVLLGANFCCGRGARRSGALTLQRQR